MPIRCEIRAMMRLNLSPTVSSLHCASAIMRRLATCFLKHTVPLLFWHRSASREDTAVK